MDDSRAAGRRCGVCDTEDQSSETVTRSRNAVGAIAHGPGSSEVWCGCGCGEKAGGKGRQDGRKVQPGVDSPVGAEESAMVIAPAVIGIPVLSASSEVVVVVVVGCSATCCGSVGSKLWLSRSEAAAAAVVVVMAELLPGRGVGQVWLFVVGPLG